KPETERDQDRLERLRDAEMLGCGTRHHAAQILEHLGPRVHDVQMFRVEQKESGYRDCHEHPESCPQRNGRDSPPAERDAPLAFFHRMTFLSALDVDSMAMTTMMIPRTTS